MCSSFRGKFLGLSVYEIYPDNIGCANCTQHICETERVSDLGLSKRNGFYPSTLEELVKLEKLKELLLPLIGSLALSGMDIEVSKVGN